MKQKVKTYSSSVSRKQFEVIRTILEGARKKTAPRKVDLYDVFNAILYLLKEGCRWRSLPSEYPDWRLVYYYFRVWKESEDGNPSILEEALKKSGLNTSKWKREA